MDSAGTLLRQTHSRALQLLLDAVDENKKLVQERERVCSERQQMQQQVSFLSRSVDENLNRLKANTELITTAEEVGHELQKVLSELPNLIAAASATRTGQERAADSLQLEHDRLFESHQRELDEAKAAECARREKDLDEKRQQVADVKHKLHQLQNQQVAQRRKHDQTDEKEAADLENDMKEKVRVWEQELYEMQGHKNLKKQMLKAEMKKLRNHLAAQLKEYRSKINEEKAQIADLKLLLRGGDEPAFKHRMAGDSSPRRSRSRELSADPAWSPDRRRSRSVDRTSGRSILRQGSASRERNVDAVRCEPRPRLVTFSDRLADHPLDSTRRTELRERDGDCGQGDGSRRRGLLPHQLVLELSDEDDDCFNKL